MAVLETLGEVLFEGKVLGLPKIVVGLGAVLAAPVVLPALRPVTKQVIKSSIMLADKTRETFAGVGEKWSDLVAEARTEARAVPSEKIDVTDQVAA